MPKTKSNERKYLADIINEMAQLPVKGYSTALEHLAQLLWDSTLDGDQHATKTVTELLIKRPPSEVQSDDSAYLIKQALKPFPEALAAVVEALKGAGVEEGAEGVGDE